jgi:hypothetical protein
LARLLIRSDQTIADLHYALQIAFNWTDSHLNSFRIHGKDFGVHHIGGPVFDKAANTVQLADFHFRLGERFIYEYDFGDNWKHQIRLKQILPAPEQSVLPLCIGGSRCAPPEECGGIQAFQQRRDEAPWRAQELLEQIAECAREPNRMALRDLAEELPEIQIWLTLDKFDRRTVNRHLKEYATGNADWCWPQEGTK